LTTLSGVRERGTSLGSGTGEMGDGLAEALSVLADRSAFAPGGDR
jgi:hypothetical protein